MGPVATSGPVPFTIPQCCTKRTGAKYVQTNACMCWAANHTCTSGCTSENCCNWGPTRVPNAPRLTTNVSQNIKEAQEFDLNLCQAISPVFFHPYTPAFSPSVLTRGSEWPALPARADTAHAAPALADTSALDPATLVAVSSGKINPNCAQPTDGQPASPSRLANPDSDVTSAASFGGSDRDLDYVKLAKNSPTILSKTPDFTGHIRKLEAMHEILEGDINDIFQTTVLLSHTNMLEIPGLADAKTDPPEKLQDYGATPPINTQISPPHSPPEDALVTSANHPPCPRVTTRDAALQAHAGDPPDVRLLGADYILYGVYQDWVHQNPVEHLDGGIAEDIK